MTVDDDDYDDDDCDDDDYDHDDDDHNHDENHDHDHDDDVDDDSDHEYDDDDDDSTTLISQRLSRNSSQQKIINKIYIFMTAHISQSQKPAYEFKKDLKKNIFNPFKPKVT